MRERIGHLDHDHPVLLRRRSKREPQATKHHGHAHRRGAKKSAVGCVRDQEPVIPANSELVPACGRAVFYFDRSKQGYPWHPTRLDEAKA